MKKTDFSFHAQIPQLHELSVYYCDRTTYLPEQICGPKLYSQSVFYYVLSGEGTLKINKSTYHVSQGEGFLILPDQTASLTADANTPLDCISIGFDGTSAGEVAQAVGMEKIPVFQGAIEDQVSFESLMYLFCEQWQNKNKYGILAGFYSILSYLKENNINAKTEKGDYMEKALDYLHHNFAYNIRIEDFAEYVGLDRTYLFKLFIKTVGVSPKEYLIRYRLEQAKKLLKETALSTSQVADSCGFRDAPSFCKHFKARYNTSPLAFRKEQQ